MALAKLDFPCKYTTNVNFPTERFCALAYKLLVSEENTHKDRSTVVYECNGTMLNVVINASNTRTLRLKVNAFYETCYLASSIMEEFMWPT